MEVKSKNAICINQKDNLKTSKNLYSYNGTGTLIMQEVGVCLHFIKHWKARVSNLIILKDINLLRNQRVTEK
jgi:hypothetical protein